MRVGSCVSVYTKTSPNGNGGGHFLNNHWLNLLSIQCIFQCLTD